MKDIYFKNTLLRATKFWIAGLLSILIAEYMGLEFSISAGIVAILSVASTKKETLATVINRFGTFSIAILTSYVIYTIFGYNMTAFIIFFGQFIFICNYFKWESAIAINSVLISHFLTFGEMNLFTFLNEFGLYIIGSTLAITVNLHLHQKNEYIIRLKSQTDEQIKIALEKMSLKIITIDTLDYNDMYLKKLNKSINIAKNIAMENYMNRFLNAEKHDIEYMLMREKQISVLHIINRYVLKIKTTTTTTKDVAGFFINVSKNFNEGNSAEELYKELEILLETLKNSQLPKTREEFEDRALLYLILMHMDEFLRLKITFYRKFKM